MGLRGQFDVRLGIDREVGTDFTLITRIFARLYLSAKPEFTIVRE